MFGLKTVGNNIFSEHVKVDGELHGINKELKKVPREKVQKKRLTDVRGGGLTLVWNKKVPNTQLEYFKKIIEAKYGERFDSYWDFHRWSIEHFENLWEELWSYLGIVYSKPYSKVFKKTGEGFLDIEWFGGAALNFAENLLRYRDDKEALICIDELGNEERVTFSEVYEAVKLYAAAFKKHGLEKGDRVACYMSNRKEAVFAMLAAASMGALFGGPQPFFGQRAAGNIIRKMEPKFLIAVDHFRDNGSEFNPIENLPLIADSVPSLEKVIIVPTKEETLSSGISHIRNSCFLEPFLESGRTPDGNVPELVFEQLPFDYPICINFTSGTTGLPKGPIHSAGTVLTHLTGVALYFNLKCGDVLFSCYPVGWALWDTFIPCLALGVKLVLYAGCPFYVRDGVNIWDLFAQYKVNYSFLASVIVDKAEKMEMVPGPNSNLDNLRMVTVGGSPAKSQNYQYLHSKVKKDMFVCSQYGATETFGTFSGFDLNSPCYAGEIQAPGLGMDIQCYDEEGRPVLGQRGEMVIPTPTPTLPIGIWKDEDKSILTEMYLSKYPGIWCQNDEIWINPETKGMVVIGRSDDTLKQHGDRFGAGDVYFAIHDMEEIEDYICVGQKTGKEQDMRAVLFVKMRKGYQFTPEFRESISQKICEELWVDCVPEVILEVKDIPYNMSNKKMESVVRKVLATNKIPEVNNIKNPECLKYYCNIPELNDCN